ncbi:MAG: S24/S26 family peptidase [Clostridia bacterium]|nr:S24/S26 family peptidase [Clostridia bacterium]
MSDTLSLKEMSPVIEEVLSSGGKVRITASGKSMEPVIKDCEDTVVISEIQNPLAVGDIVLYKRANGRLVLHRIVAINGSEITLRGDSQWTTETVDKSVILGILEAVERNGKVLKLNNMYFKKYKITLPAIRWKNRIINSIKIRLGAKTNDKHS